MAYDPNFIQGKVVDLPELTPAVQQQAFNGGVPVDHTNFSLVFNQVRGFATYSANNIDAATFLDKGPKRKGFTLDPLVPKQLQVDNDRGYKGFPSQEDNPWDAGHLARRKSLHWPDLATATLADKQSSHWTNITPQHKDMNRQGKPWAKVENFLLDKADNDSNRACVFTGPVFTASDHTIINKEGELPIQIPSGHWKIAVIKRNDKLCAASFLLWQCDMRTCAPVELDPVLEQVRLNTIEYLTGLLFDEDIRQADPLRFEGPNAACVVEDGDDLAV